VEDRLKKRLIGASVFVALLVIFLPMLVEEEELETPRVTRTTIPPQPQFDDSFRSRLLPNPESPIVPAPPPKPEAAEGEEAELPGEKLTDQPVEVDEAPPPPPKEQKTAKAPPTLAPGVSAWVVQVVSYTVEEKARNVANDLIGKGFTAFVEPARVGGKDYFRVRVGPEADRGRAAQAAERIARDLKVEAQVVRYP